MFSGHEAMTNKQDKEQGDLSSGGSNLFGGRRRRRSRSRRGRKGRGGYLTDLAVAAGFLGATQLSKRRAGYGFTGRNGYYGKTRRKGSGRSSRSRRRR